MKALYFDSQGSFDSLAYGEFDDPEMHNNQVKVRVYASALNGFEPMMVLGTTGLKTPLPMIPSGDVAGEIVDVGSEVADGQWRVGDRVLVDPVMGTKMMGETALGGACEYVVSDIENLIRIPAGVSFAKAACLQIAYGTAYRMMMTMGTVKKGDTVLILGATGGVGIACLQFAKLMGATVIACGSAKWKTDKLKALGADYVVDTSKEDFSEFIKSQYGRARVTGDGGVDVVVNYLGGEYWDKGLKCVKKGGQMLVCGATAGYDAPTDIRYVWSFERSIIGSDGWTRDDIHDLLDLVASGDLDPEIDSVYDFSDGVSAIDKLYNRNVMGKVVLVPEGEKSHAA